MFNSDYLFVPFGSQMKINHTDQLHKDQYYVEYYIFGLRIARFRVFSYGDK